MQSDALSLTLADVAPHILLPPTGAELRVWLGYGTRVQFMGLYVVDGITIGGPPDSMSIKANGAPFEKSENFSELQTQRTRSWLPQSVGELVRCIAAEHGLVAAIADALDRVMLSHLDQINESSMNLLTRVAAGLGAVAKANGGALVFVRKGEGLSASGQELPTLPLTPRDVTNWSVSISGRENYRSVVATWRDVATAQDVEECVGEGEPVFRIRHSHPSREAAQQAARAKLDSFSSGKRTLSLTLPGDPALRAECRVELSGFRDGVNGTWSIARAEHRLGSGGYVTSLDAECV
nr:contractile injection system protein, VgrG/Pvc8 family [Desulfobaculum xiamenense]